MGHGARACFCKASATAGKQEADGADAGNSVAHNPSGVDPTEEQWKKIADLCEAKKAIPIFDTAYQVRACVLPASSPSRALAYTCL